jgi:hypothetical protein
MMAGVGNNVDIGALASQAVGGGVAGAIVAAIVGNGVLDPTKERLLALAGGRMLVPPPSTFGPRDGMPFRPGKRRHDTQAVRTWMGHKNIQHTVRYTELSPTRSKEPCIAVRESQTFLLKPRECVASAWHSHNHKKTTLTSHLAISCLMKGRLMALAIFGVAVAMLACMQGWNAAAHRKDESTARVMSILFYVFTAVLIGSLAKMIFFGG